MARPKSQDGSRRRESVQTWLNQAEFDYINHAINKIESDSISKFARDALLSHAQKVTGLTLQASTTVAS